MTRTPVILIADCSASDTGLAELLLRRSLPEADIRIAGDAIAFAEALAAGNPDVAIVAPRLTWTSSEKLIGLLRRRAPRAGVILFGHEADLLACTANADFAFDGIARKSSAGYMALADIVADVLARGAEPAAPNPATAHPADGVNHEMRDIALVFSHDLKEPVQQVARLAQRAVQGDGASGARAANSMQQILDCANRASDLLDSLLEYLAVSARDSTPVLVDLNRSLAQALDNLRGVIEETDASIEADHLPAIIGDEYQMLHLLQNLISNALKFRGRDRPQIRIEAKAQGNEWLLSVRDNGIGIAQPFLTRVFEMGQRLHTRDEYPGTGVGLALCKRIVERHGGHIWAQSNDGPGTTFFVRIPRTTGQITRLA
jgi:signal transduction histidine kinase